MPTLEIPFAVGSEVWWIGPAWRQEEITCPECLGQRRIKVVLPTGDEYMLKCCACGGQWGEPRGLVTVTRHEHIPRRITLDRVESIDMAAESRVTYRTANGILVYSHHLYLDEGECRSACETRNAEMDAEDERRAIATMLHGRERLAWSAHYWRGQLQKAEANVVLARERLGLSLEREEALRQERKRKKVAETE